MLVNTKYKDSVFSLLFSDPDLLRELYCALEGVELPHDTPVTINTLQDVLFKDRINDISFEIDGKIVVLLEHQSTVNPNLPLRMLMYIGRLYEKITADRNVYSRKRLRIPHAQFYVLYNGKEELPDCAELKLSDMFESTSPLGIPAKEVVLELAVKVLNINHGRNADVAKRCKTLAGYSAFVAKAREFDTGIPDKTDAVKKAVKYCREHDILKEFMVTHSTEVFNMLMADWKWDDVVAASREDGIEDGMEKRDREIARNALAEGAPIEFVSKITGLDLETLAELQASVQG